MCCRDPRKRPDTATVLAHPVWWPPQRKLAFVLDVSDRFETSDREAESSPVLQALEATAASVFPPGANWATKLEPNLLSNLYQYRRYKYGSVRDLLRVIRNKANHYRELPEDLQKLLGEPPSAYYKYFAARFPRLLLTMLFFVVSTGAHTETQFEKYELADADFSKCHAVYAPAPSGSMSARQVVFGPSAAVGCSNTSGTPRGSSSDITSSALVGPDAVANTSPGAGIASNASSERTLPATPITARSGKAVDSLAGFGTLSPHAESPKAPVDTSAGSDVPSSPKLSGRGTGKGGSGKSKGKRVSNNNSGDQAAVVNNIPMRPPQPPGPQGPPPMPLYYPPGVYPMGMYGPQQLPHMLHTPTPPTNAPNGTESPKPPKQRPNQQSSQSPAPPPGIPVPVNGVMPFMNHSHMGLPPVHTSVAAQNGQVQPHPPSQPPPQPPPSPGGSGQFHVGWTDSGSDAGSFSSFPKNPGAQLCDYFVRTGHCKYGSACFKDHPEHYSVKLNLVGLPLRRGMQPCPYFMQHASCEYGPACKFHHPNLEPAYSAGAQMLENAA